MVWYQDIGTNLFGAFIEYLKYPWVLLLIVPLFFVILLLLKKDFVKLKEEEDRSELKVIRKKQRKVILFTRTILFILLLIAIATPYVEQTKTTAGEPFIRVVIDNSTSMGLLDTSEVGPLIRGLESQIEVDVVHIPGTDTSAIGDAVLDNIAVDENVLLITDGNNNKGADLGDVALYASRLNASINVIDLKASKADARVTIRGPDKTLENVDNQYTVSVQTVGDAPTYALKVLVDDQQVPCDQIGINDCVFTTKFSDGVHKITAMVDIQDTFEQNNIFYKTVAVVSKPRVLFYSEKDSPMYTLLSQVYEVTRTDNLPDDLSRYHTVIINDIPASRLNAKIDQLTDYVTEGNGLFVIGGLNAYDRGGYKDSLFETLLPVSIGEAAKKEGDVNIVLVIDISGSTGQQVAGGAEAVDVEKALALGVMEDLRFDNKLAIVAFNVDSYLIEPLSYIFEKQDVAPKIKRLQDSGGTLIDAGILRAIDILKVTQGSKNIILISDGMTQIIPRTIAAAELSKGLGIKIYTIGVGAKTNEQLMRAIADISTGIYFRAEQEHRLRILFGEIDQQESGEYGVVILNANHFVTEDLDISASVLGYNQVVPKSAGRLLVTTSQGDPLLTVWRFGLGRIAALSTDDGSLYAAQLLSKNNSKIITRIVNWASGEPERKSDSFISVEDTRVNIPTEITVKSAAPPTAEGVLFYKTDEGFYQGEITPTQQGFNSVLNTLFAANYPVEYEELGMNPEIQNIVSVTQGKVFQPSDVPGIIEHVKSRAIKTERKKDNLRWPFVLAALAIFLIEILIRKIISNKRQTI
ncbi:VWA domain-containing protein [Candidatus Woesearchaeota archaeon]|nr:VWA domain-containing protein [Candidatus Woesearchaeota archaeon]